MEKKKEKAEYEIDRELTGKLAIESNAELQDRLEQLEEENKKLKSDLAEIQKIGENWRQECKQLRKDVDYFRQCYLDLKKLCEKEGFMLSDEEVTKMFNLDKIK